MAGSMPASAAIARMVALRKPSAANRRRAASTIAARVASERRAGGSSVMSTTVGQHLLTCQWRAARLEVNKRWPTGVDFKEYPMNAQSKTLPSSTSVVIVGAGPAGLAAAITLADAGVDFVLLDRQAEGANTSRACVVHAR